VRRQRYASFDTPRIEVNTGHTRRFIVDPNLHRRAFLARAALAPIAGAAGAGFECAAGAAPTQTPVKPVGGAKLKSRLKAYSCNKALNDHLKGRGKGLTLFELLDYCAEQNFDAIDPTGYFFPGYPKGPDDKYVNDFKRRAFHLGLNIS